MFTGLISSASVYCVAHAGQKPQKYRNFNQIFTSHFTDLGQIWQETVGPMVYANKPNLI